jgi:hypothetical protein
MSQYLTITHTEYWTEYKPNWTDNVAKASDNVTKLHMLVYYHLVQLRLALIIITITTQMMDMDTNMSYQLLLTDIIVQLLM